MDLKGSAALVTGGGSGLGAATVLHLAERGCHVAYLDIQKGTTEEVSSGLAGNVYFIQTDVTDELQVQHAVDSALTVFGAIHITVNCAGIVAGSKVVGKSGPHPFDLFEKVIRINLLGTFNVMRLATHAMLNNEPNREGERGVIINTSSVAAYEGQVGQLSYAASKGGIASMTLPAARDMAPQGVRVMAIAPGIFHTPLMDSLSEEVRDSLGKQVPFPSRLGKPVEFARLVEAIIQNPMLNGEVIRLDGAIRMAPR